MIRHLLVIVGMLVISLSLLIWLCRTVDPSTKYGSEVEYNYARYCAGCHGGNGQGGGRIGRFKRFDPADFTTLEFWDKHSDEQMAHSVASGKDDMPAFKFYLNDEKQQELLAFIKETFRPTLMDVE
ncbi:MAG: c-type cytochrome [Candidatus Poribacteria bacterium]|nr:c-type cytochrome [Candidatus Poribacteria bacterium]